MEHVEIPLGEIHRPVNWEFANAAARAAATPIAGEVGLFSLQLDVGVLYRLESIGPPVWRAIGAVGGGGDLAYTHEQMTASAAWVVNHGLGKYPSVIVIDSAGSEVEGEITYVTVNQVQLGFSAAFSGVAHFN